MKRRTIVSLAVLVGVRHHGRGVREHVSQAIRRSGGRRVRGRRALQRERPGAGARRCAGRHVPHGGHPRRAGRPLERERDIDALHEPRARLHRAVGAVRRGHRRTAARSSPSGSSTRDGDPISGKRAYDKVYVGDTLIGDAATNDRRNATRAFARFCSGLAGRLGAWLRPPDLLRERGAGRRVDVRRKGRPGRRDLREQRRGRGARASRSRSFRVGEHARPAQLG